MASKGENASRSGTICDDHHIAIAWLALV